MRESVSLGSKKKGAKEIEIKVTKKKIFVFLLCLGGLVYLLTSFFEEPIKEIVGDEMIIGCTNGSQEVVAYGKEIYCSEHYSILQGKVSNYERMQQIIEEKPENE